MEKRNLIILAIISSGIIGIAYASSGTVITDTSITTPNLTVTGTCTGCASTEASYSTWTLSINKTINAGTSVSYIERTLIANDGSPILSINSPSTPKTFILDSSGNIINNYNYGDGNAMVATAIEMSETGMYKIMFSNDNGTAYIYKNNVIAKSIIIGSVAGKNGFNGNTVASRIAISPSGQYIMIAGVSSTTNSFIINVYKGS